jgi:hyperosmotically inducible protein
MMKTLPNSRLVLASAVLTVLFASGCERRTPDAAGTAPADTPAATTGVTPAPTTPADPTVSTPGQTSAGDPSVSTPGQTTTGGDNKSAGTVIEDTVITTKVKTALMADSDIKGLDVNVDTAHGVVTLNGAVNNQTQIDRAAKVTGDVSGVSSVVNNLTIKKQ